MQTKQSDGMDLRDALLLQLVSMNSHAKISGLLKEMLNAPGALLSSALQAGRRRRLGRIAAALFRGLAAVVTAPALAAVRVAAAAVASSIPVFDAAAVA